VVLISASRLSEKGRSALPRKILQQCQILHQTIKLGLLGIRIRRTQNRRGVSGDQTGLTDGFNMRELAANIRDTDGYPENTRGGGRTESNHHFGLDQFDLCLKPGTAGMDFSRGRFFVQPAFTEGFPFKMLNGVGDVAEITIDLRLIQSAIQQPAGWSDEWETSAIFSITGLFADK
jgi:hypothetical protein